MPFAGWTMPIQYTGVISEHRAVRNVAGLFDVSHMGELRVAGSGALAFLQRLTPNNVARLKPGRAHYSALLTPEGTYLDDLLVYRWTDDEYLLVVNAANQAKDLAWLESQVKGDVAVEDVSERYALLALQGPRAEEFLQPLTELELPSVRYYGFVHGEVAGLRAVVSRTGYTGEDGFEIFVAPEQAVELWETILAVGGGDGLCPVGLGARDTLRIEAAMALYGQEIDESTTPFEAGLDWTVKLAKGEFIGREVLIEQRQAGARRRLVGFNLVDRGIARQGHEVMKHGRAVGKVTSGTWSPTLERAIGMACVPLGESREGSKITIAVRKKLLEAEIVALPFYRRSKQEPATSG